jgi:cell division protein FtsB
MAKALVGYVGGVDPRKVREARQLRQRIIDLESEVRRLKEENDALAAAYRRSSLERTADLDRVRVLQPATR